MERKLVGYFGQELWIGKECLHETIEAARLHATFQASNGLVDHEACSSRRFRLRLLKCKVRLRHKSGDGAFPIDCIWIAAQYREVALSRTNRIDDTQCVVHSKSFNGCL